jgi:steroid delta-isomerase-like uncharacterized protein
MWIWAEPGDWASLAGMTTPTDLERFFGYARDFELAYLTDDWARIRPWFAEGAVHTVENGGVLGSGASGAAAVVDDLRDSVRRVDRRFDVRIPEIVDGPRTRADGVFMRWMSTLRRDGLPDLRLEGDHLTVYEDDKIVAIHERLAAETPQRVAAYLAEHGAKLRPEGAPFAPPRDARDLEPLAAASARTLVRVYGCAKSEADVGAALAVCSDDFGLDALTLGVTARGRAECAATLRQFFRAFPDYSVKLEGFANGAGALAAWGRARMTLQGSWLGFAPTGKTAELPVFCVFDVANGALASERFFVDRATLFEQLGLPLGASDRG